MCPAVLDRDVLTFAITCFSKTLAECRYLRDVFGRLRIEEPNYRQRRLLRTCRKRPRCRRPAEQRNELAPFQWIEEHSVPSQGPIAEYRNSEDQSGGKRPRPLTAGASS